MARLGGDSLPLFSKSRIRKWSISESGFWPRPKRRVEDYDVVNAVSIALHLMPDSADSRQSDRAMALPSVVKHHDLLGLTVDQACPGFKPPDSILSVDIRCLEPVVTVLHTTLEVFCESICSMIAVSGIGIGCSRLLKVQPE